MGFFKKKSSPDVVDLTDLQKRGLLSTPAPEKNEKGVVDFSSVYSQDQSSSSTAAAASPAGDFLSSLASAGSSNTPEDLHPSPGTVTSSLRSARQRSLSDSKINELRLKMEDNDYKLNNLIEKVRELEEKISEKEI